MSDVTMAETQDAIADSLLGEPTQSEPTADTPVTETPEAETEQLADATEEPVEQSEEIADDWLPEEQEKVFPDDVLLKFAQSRYQRDEQWLADPLNRQLVIDKLNSDIYLRQLTERMNAQPQVEEEAVAKLEPTQPTQPQITREQYIQNLQRAVEQRTDPEMAKAAYTGFLKAFGVPDAEIANLAATQSLPFAHNLSMFGLNLMNTFVGDMVQSQLKQMMDQAFPGFGGLYSNAAMANAWESVRVSNPAFASLGQFGSDSFKEAMDKVAEEYPAIADMAVQLRDSGRFHGKEAEKIYQTVARIAVGQRPDPALLQRAAAAGAKNAQRAAVKRSAGNLGSGQSKAGQQSAGSSKFQSNSDIFDDETMEMWKREHGRL